MNITLVTLKSFFYFSKGEWDMNSSILTPFPGYNICLWIVAKVMKVNIELNKENILNAKALMYVIHVNAPSTHFTTKPWNELFGITRHNTTQ